MRLITLAAGGSLVALLMAGTALTANAADVTVEMNNISEKGVGDKAGTVVIAEKEGGGLSLTVDIKGVPAGEHGFHVHAKGECAPGVKDGKEQAGLAAAGHFDPAETKSHKGPEGPGHKGDLPFLTATHDGVNVVVTAPHLTLADVRGRALMVHAGGDNYSDNPENGGGKGRIICGVVPKG